MSNYWLDLAKEREKKERLALLDGESREILRILTEFLKLLPNPEENPHYNTK